ncbi:hypothetical protein EAF00_007818 [Botryotinia globosa]|nr:hypothetical protein EAF00_007818 [Botryotinia globosa]
MENQKISTNSEPRESIVPFNGGISFLPLTRAYSQSLFDTTPTEQCTKVICTLSMCQLQIICTPSYTTSIVIVITITIMNHDHDH